MSNYKETFQNYSSEYLLKKRALGTELAEAAHLAIEEIFRERGESLPPRPTRPISVAELQGQAGSQNRGDKIFGLVAVVLAMIVSKMVANMFGLLILLAYAIYWGINWLRKSRLTDAERAREREAKRAEDECLSELMIAAAKGDVLRVNELIAYGADVNLRTLKGATALIYAARNNQVESVRALLAAGADVKVKFDKGETAEQVAQRYGYVDIVSLFKLHVQT